MAIGQLHEQGVWYTSVGRQKIAEGSMEYRHEANVVIGWNVDNCMKAVQHQSDLLFAGMSIKCASVETVGESRNEVDKSCFVAKTSLSSYLLGSRAS